MPDGPQPKKTFIEPGLVDRILGLSKYVLNGDLTWMGPGQSPPPAAQDETKGRAFDYAIAVNTQLGGKARESSGITFPQLRFLADECELLRLVIERRKAQMRKRKLAIVATDPELPGTDEQIAHATRVFARPDGVRDWGGWLNAFLEDYMVADAVAIEPRYNAGGQLERLDLIDGTTIEPLIDAGGRIPEEGPAYRQVLKGIAANELTRKELIYVVQNHRTNHVYGFSVVEQILMSCTMEIRRELHKLEFYTTGALPDCYTNAPEGYTPDQITKLQEKLNTVLSGNTAERRRIIVLPFGSRLENPKEIILKDDFDEWLARKVAFAFGMSPSAFVQQVIRATAETHREEALEEGQLPVVEFICGTIRTILHDYMGYTNLDCVLDETKILSDEVQSKVDDMRIRNGTRGIDEIRKRDGLEPIGAEIMIWTPTGPMTAEQYNAGTVPGPAAPPGGGFGGFAAGGVPTIKRAGSKLVKPPPNEIIPVQEAALAPVLEQLFVTEAPKIAEQIVSQYPEDEIVTAIKRGKIKPLTQAEINDIVEDIDMTGWGVVVGSTEASIAEVARKGAANVFGQFAITDESLFNQATEEVVEYARTRGAAMVGMRYNAKGALVAAKRPWMAITETTRQDLRVLITNAVDKGMTRNQLASAIQASHTFAPGRARSIAQTELAMANGHANVAAWDASGIVKGRRWILSNRHPEDDICDRNAEQGTVKLRVAFVSGHMTAPAHPECLCDTVAET